MTILHTTKFDFSGNGVDQDLSELPSSSRNDFAGFVIMLTSEAEINYIVGQMTQPAPLGEFEQVVLLAVLRLGDNAYGVTIRSEIAACTGRDAAPGALYTTLDRMEEKGLVRSWLGDATPQRGGRAKRYFALTKVGRAALISAQRAYQSLLDGLDLVRGANA